MSFLSNILSEKKSMASISSSDVKYSKLAATNSVTEPKQSLNIFRFFESDKTITLRDLAGYWELSHIDDYWRLKRIHKFTFTNLPALESYTWLCHDEGLVIILTNGQYIEIHYEECIFTLKLIFGIMTCSYKYRHVKDYEYDCNK
jgi:hypothetical protein